MAKQNGSTRSSQSRQKSQSRTGEESGATRAQQPSGGSPSRAKGDRRGRTSGGRSQRQQSQQPQVQASGRGVGIARTGAKVVDAVRQNPIPAALIGAGLAWLLVQNRGLRLSVGLPHMPRALTGAAEAAREAFSEAAETTRESVSGAIETVGERLGSAAESVKDGTLTLAVYAQDGAASVGRAARKGLTRSREAAADTWHSHPLTVGLALLAAGVATGMMLPATSRGGGFMGRAARELTRSVKSSSEELLDKGREVISSSVRAATREAKRQGLTANEVGRKVRRVASSARNAATS